MANMNIDKARKWFLKRKVVDKFHFEKGYYILRAKANLQPFIYGHYLEDIRGGDLGRALDRVFNPHITTQSELLTS